MVCTSKQFAVASVAVLSAASVAPTTPAPAVAPEYQAGDKDAGMSQTSSKRIGIVLNSLKEILNSVQAGERKDAGNYKCFMEFCASEISSTNQSLVDTQENLELGQVNIKRLKTSTVSLSHELIGNKDERSGAGDTLAQATKLRDEDRDEFEEESTTNTQSLKQIDKAIEIVGAVHRQGGFLQAGHLQRIRLNEPGESKYVVGIMKGLKEKLERTKGQIDGAEKEKEQQYDALYTTKKAQISSLEDDYAQKQVHFNEQKVSLAEAKNDVEELATEVQTLSESLRKMQVQCRTKEHEWVVKSEDRHAEKAALREAIAFVAQTEMEEEQSARTTSASALLFAQRDLSIPIDDAALIQVSRRHRIRRRMSQTQPLPQVTSGSGLLASALVASADAQFSTLMTGVDSHQRKEGFQGAVKVVRELIQVLKDQQKDEKEKKTYCQREIASKDDEKAITEEMLDALAARIEKRRTEIEVAENEIAQLNRTNAEAQKNDQEAAKLRGEEEAAYKVATKDRRLAVRVLHQAKQVLQKFYKSKQAASLAQAEHVQQLGQKPAPKTWTSAGNDRQSVQSAGVLLMLEKVAEEIEAEQKHADGAERTSKREYSSYMDDSRHAFDERMGSMTMHVTRRARDLVKVNNDKDDQSSLKQDHESISQQLSALHGECDQLLQNYEQRQKARSFEVSQLLDVVDILSGSSEAVRTGDAAAPPAALIVKSTGPEDSELAALQEMSKTIGSLQSRARDLKL